MKLVSKTTIGGLALFTALGLFVFWIASAPHPLTNADVPEHLANVENGKLLFNIGGCISCHAPGPTVKNVAADVPAGGKPLSTPIGILYPPNLTPDRETGLGYWTDLNFINAMQEGLGPRDEHLIPVFPYTSYTHMTGEDVLDIKAYLATFAPVKNAVKPHEIWFEPVIRRGLGLWKLVGFDKSLWQADAAQSASWNRGSYLVNGPGHCSECHTPRTLMMASDTARMFAGGPHPEGKGMVPSLRELALRSRYKDVADLVLAFQNGEELGYDKMNSGGMGEVRKNIAKLPEAYVKAISEYVMSLK